MRLQRETLVILSVGVLLRPKAKVVPQRDVIRGRYSGNLMENQYSFACLGRPYLVGRDGDPVPVKTRKALAIIGYLARQSDFSSPRRAVADILWSQADRTKAMQSMRQALRQLKDAGEAAAFEFVISSSSELSLDLDKFHTDLDVLLTLIGTGRNEDFQKAFDLWRGDFLSGFEDLDPDFAEWVQVERERVRSQVISETLKHLETAAVEEKLPHVESAALFLLHMDPALETAHQVLIRYYMALGQAERAEQQFRICERELKLHLDESPTPQTEALLTTVTGGTNQPVVVGHSGSRFSPVHVANDAGDSQIILPDISIVSVQPRAVRFSDAANLKDEVVSGLSSYQAFNLFHSDYFGSEDVPKPTLVQADDLGSFLLRFHYNDANEKISIQFEDRLDGRILFNEIVDLALWDSVQAAASQTISRVHKHVIGRLKNPKNTAAFAKWCQAEALMWEFDSQSDRKAMDLLNDLERNHSSFSMLFSGKALINMKQLIHYPVADKQKALDLDGILSLCEHAVMLDPWQPLNQRAHGWALTQAGNRELARKAFLNAGRFNSVDPSNLMSVAEGLAFAGDVKLAKRTAETAMNLFTSVPRVFYEYYANVFFAAEDFETSAQLMERSSYSSISGLITRIAALVCDNREREAIEVLSRHSETYAAKIRATGLGQGDPHEWARRINFFQEPKARFNYEKGVDLVRRYFFGERASIS